MEMLVTKFSNGKYRNEGELFKEVISAENVKLMGEMIALQALRTVKKYDLKIADKLYIGLIKDLHHINEIDYTVSDGYDCAQTAICFLYQFMGRKVSEIYGKDRKGKEITIKHACYREIDRFIDGLRNRPDRHKQVEYIDFTNYKALPMDPVNCFEKEQDDYRKADALMDAMHLTGKEREMLEYYMSGWKRSEIAKILCVTKSCMLFLYEETGGEEFLPVLHEWAEYAMHYLPRTCEGGIQHSCTGSPNPGQIWDDTLYMTVLFLAKYGVLFGRDDCLEESVYQFLVHIKYLTHRRSGLWYHGWSFGRGDHFAGALWARGNSWITAGIPAFFEIARPQGAARRFIAEAYVRQAESLRSLQDASGLWHTLLDDPSSYLESSASANFAYGFLKGIRMGLLPAPFAESAEKAVQALISCIGPDGIVQNCSYGTGMGSTLQAYREIPVCPMPYGQTLTALALMEYIKFSQTAPV